MTDKSQFDSEKIEQASIALVTAFLGKTSELTNSSPTLEEFESQSSQFGDVFKEVMSAFDLSMDEITMTAPMLASTNVLLINLISKIVGADPQEIWQTLALSFLSD